MGLGGLYCIDLYYFIILQLRFNQFILDIKWQRIKLVANRKIAAVNMHSSFNVVLLNENDRS